MMMKMTVWLNGTSVNPYAKWGLKCNPFPIICEAEYSGREMPLRKLASEPIPHDTYEQYIRETLNGFSQQFVDLMVSQFRPGRMISVTVSWNE